MECEMIKRAGLPLAMTLAMLALTATAWSQVLQVPRTATPPPPTQKPGAPAARPPQAMPAHSPVQNQPQREEMKARVREQIRAVRAKKLAEVVKPDAATAARLQDVVGLYDEQMIAVRKDAQATRRDLTQLLKINPNNVQQLTRLTDQLLGQRARLQQIENDRTAAMRKLLTPEQYARIILAWRKVNREIQEQIYKAVFKSRGDNPAPRDDEE